MQTLADDDVNMSISIRLFIITRCSIKSFLCRREENSLSRASRWNKRAAEYNTHTQQQTASTHIKAIKFYHHHVHRKETTLGEMRPKKWLSTRC